MIPLVIDPEATPRAPSSRAEAGPLDQLPDLRRAFGKLRGLRDLPAHPLVADGFTSVGCVPCTRRAGPGVAGGTLVGPGQVRMRHPSAGGLRP